MSTRRGFEGEGFAAIMLGIIVIGILMAAPTRKKPSEPWPVAILRWVGRLILLALASYGLWALKANGHLW